MYVCVCCARGPWALELASASFVGRGCARGFVLFAVALARCASLRPCSRLFAFWYRPLLFLFISLVFGKGVCLCMYKRFFFLGPGWWSDRRGANVPRSGSPGVKQQIMRPGWQGTGSLAGRVVYPTGWTALQSIVYATFQKQRAIRRQERSGQRELGRDARRTGPDWRLSGWRAARSCSSYLFVPSRLEVRRDVRRVSGVWCWC
jgi:hypothetical protein